MEPLEIPADSITRFSEASWNPCAANSSNAAARISLLLRRSKLGEPRSDHEIAAAVSGGGEGG